MNNRQSFTVTYKERIFNFELNLEDGMVWLVQNDEIPSKTNNGQVSPARNIEEAKKIAKLMLYASGY